MRCVMGYCKCERQSPVNNAVDGMGLSAVKGDDVACSQFAILVQEGLANLAKAANSINTSLRQKDRVAAVGPN
jgi:hypothetical protein